MSKKIERFEKKVKSIEENLVEIKQEVDNDKIKKEKDKLSENISLVKEEISEHLDELRKDIDKNSDEIKKLEELSKKIDSFSTELSSLKEVILKKDDKKEDVDGEPSLFANIFYGGLIANTLGNIPLIGNSIKSWTNKKLKESAKEDSDEKAGKEKKSWLGRAWNTIFWSGVVSGSLWLGRKIIPDDWMKEIKTRFPWTDEAKSDKENKEKIKKENEEKIKKEKEEKEKIDKPKPVVVTPEEGDEGLNGDESDEINPAEVLAEDEDVELTPEEEEATEEVKKMCNEGNSELYIITKMYQMGFVPKFDMGKWKGSTLKGKFSYILSGGPFTKYPDAAMKKGVAIRGDIHKWMTGWLKESSLKQEFAYYKKDINSMLRDLETGKIKTLKDFELKYGASISKKFNRDISKLKNGIENESKKFEETKKKVDGIEKNINDIQKQTHEKLKELDKKAKNDPKNKEKYQKEAKEITKKANKNIAKAEGSSGIELSKLTKNELLKISKESSFVKKTMKINNGIDGFMKKTKAGKMMIGGMLLGLAIEGVDGKSSWEDIGWQAGDLGVSMIPFVGGLYDIGTAVFGSSIASEELSVSDRAIRAGVGLASVVLDVAGIFTAGAGNAASVALKASVKVGSKAAKVVKLVKASAEVAKLGMYGFLGYTLYTQVEPYVVDLAQRVDKKTTSDVDITSDEKIESE